MKFPASLVTPHHLREELGAQERLARVGAARDEERLPLLQLAVDGPPIESVQPREEDVELVFSLAQEHVLQPGPDEGETLAPLGGLVDFTGHKGPAVRRVEGLLPGLTHDDGSLIEEVGFHPIDPGGRSRG